MSVTLRLVIAALSMACCYRTASAEPSNSPSKPQTATAIIRLAGEVDDFRRDTLIRHFRQAEAAGAKTVILEIDTNGGLVTSGLDIARFLRGQTLHTIAFVNNKAISAGSMIALACDEIVMAPGSVLGDCAPIIFADSSVVPMPETERAKQESPILLDFSESAKRNHYNPLLTRAMVKVNISIYLVRNAKGEERAVDKDEYTRLLAAGGWKAAPNADTPIDGPLTLLTVGADMAKRLGLSKGVARSAQDLATQRGLTIVADLSPGFGDHLVEFFNGAMPRFFLMVVFLLALYISLHAPGHGAAEAIAIVSLGMLVAIPMLTGYGQWWELVMILIGLALIAFELLVFPGHGVSLILGILMVLGGLLLTFAGKDIGPGWLPHSPEAWHRMKGGLKVIVGAIFAAMVVGSIIRPFLPKLPFFRKLILSEVSGQPAAQSGTPLKAGEDVWPFVGTIGLAKTDLRPGGVVQFPYGADRRNADVVCVSGFVSAGAKVVVQEARGNRIVVRGTIPAESARASS